MPGIAGIVGPGVTEQQRPIVEAMIGTMKHEPSYRCAVHVDEDLQAVVGWTAHEGSFGDDMPVRTDGGDVSLIFSGEDFRDVADVQKWCPDEPAMKRHRASYLAQMYDAMGSEFLGQINGWFSGILLDRRTRTILLFNDRYGVNRLFYHEARGVVYFASEAKALLKVLPELRRLDPRGLGEFMSLGCVLQDRTLFSGVRSVPGGTVWTLRPGRPVSKGTYFDPTVWENQEPLNAEDYYQRLKAVWAEIVPRYVHDPDGVGLSLTGGVDSRMILAWAPSAPGSLPCYTWGGLYRECADVRISRQVAQQCGQPHRTIPVGREFLADFPRIVERAVYISDGTMDASGSIDLYVQQQAREIAPLRVGGVYGGEILRRLVVFRPSLPFSDFLELDASAAVAQAADTYADERRGHPLSFTLFKQAPWYMTSKFAIERSAVTYRTPYFDNELVSLVYRAPETLAESNDVSLRLILDGRPELRHVETDFGLRYPPVRMLTPLRHLWQELTFKAEYAYDYGMPQWLATANHLLSPLRLERLFLGRHKVHHFRAWYRDELAAYLRDILLDPRALQRPYIRRPALEHMVHGHTSGRSNFTLELHRILACELIQRQLIENS